jgi:hypothetical protein
MFVALGPLRRSKAQRFSTDHGGGKRRAGNSAAPILLGLALYRWRIRVLVGYDGASVGPKKQKAMLAPTASVIIAVSHKVMARPMG